MQPNVCEQQKEGISCFVYCPSQWSRLGSLHFMTVALNHWRFRDPLWISRSDVGHLPVGKRGNNWRLQQEANLNACKSTLKLWNRIIYPTHSSLSTLVKRSASIKNKKMYCLAWLMVEGFRDPEKAFGDPFENHLYGVQWRSPWSWLQRLCEAAVFKASLACLHETARNKNVHT